MTNTIFHKYKTNESIFDFERWRWLISYDKRSYNISNSYSYYQTFCNYLSKNERVCVRPFSEFTSRIIENKASVFLRHDIDLDPHSALELSAALNDSGLTGSFYLLHTARYYADLNNDSRVVNRHTNLIEVVKPIQDIYCCEIGLHTDPLGLYINHSLDGAEAVVKELEWLRNNGISVTGSAAHNSATVYGAENFEIFSGRSLRGRRSFKHKDKTIPLQVLSEKELGLFYEANEAQNKDDYSKTKIQSYLNYISSDPSRDETWMRLFLLDNPCNKWLSDYNIWLTGKDSWVISGKHGVDPIFRWNVTLESVFDFLNNAPPSSRIVVHIHPFYIACRDELLYRHPQSCVGYVPRACSNSAEKTIKIPYYITKHLSQKLSDNLRTLIITRSKEKTHFNRVSFKTRRDYLKFSSPSMPLTVLSIEDSFSNLPFTHNSFDLVLIDDSVKPFQSGDELTFFTEVWRVLDHHGWLLGVENFFPWKTGKKMPSMSNSKRTLFFQHLMPIIRRALDRNIFNTNTIQVTYQFSLTRLLQNNLSKVIYVASKDSHRNQK